MPKAAKWIWRAVLGAGTQNYLRQGIASIRKDSKDRQVTTLLWGLPLMIFAAAIFV